MRLTQKTKFQLSFPVLRLLAFCCLLGRFATAYALPPVPVAVDVSFESTLTAEAFGDKTTSGAIVLFSLKKQLYDQFNSSTGSDYNLSSFSIRDILLSAPNLDPTVHGTINTISFGYRETPDLPTRWLLRAQNISLSSFRSGNYAVSKENEFQAFSDRISTDVTGSPTGTFSLPNVYFVLHIVFSRPLPEFAPSIEHFDVNIKLRADIEVRMEL